MLYASRLSLIWLVLAASSEAGFSGSSHDLLIAERPVKKPHKVVSKPPNNVGAKCKSSKDCYTKTTGTSAYCNSRKRCAVHTLPSKTTSAPTITSSAVPPAGSTVYELSPAWDGTSTLVQKGNSGVSAMHMVVVGNTHVLFEDKTENNPLTINGHPAWMSYMDVNTLKVTAINAVTNSFCASGTWLGNGTLVGVGGSNPSFSYDANGLQAIRLFKGCGDNGCPVYENTKTVRMASTRWYPGNVRLPDGSVLIMGGMHYPGFNDWAQSVNPTLEYYPPKNLANSMGMPIFSQFLSDAMNTNLFPVMHLLPDGTTFVAANTLAMIYNWQKNTETRLPGIPNGVMINYPWTASTALLPLRPATNYQPEVWFCGGSLPGQDGNLDGSQYSAQMPTTNQCSRMVLTPAGIQAGWFVEYMPTPSIMGTAVLTPDGSILMWGGAQTGIAGYGNVADQVGQSNADNPVLTPTLYQPNAPVGQRFSQNFPASKIARMYHSTASLLADGRIFIAGSNPNDNVVSGTPYATEYRTEFFSPPYMSMNRPSYSGLPAKIGYNAPFNLKVNVPAGSNISVSLMDLGYSTHSVNYNMKMVELVWKLGSDGHTLTVTGPPTSNHYAPGYAWLYILANGIPSTGQRVLVGSGASPPVDQAALKYVLKHTPTNPIKVRPTNKPER